MRKCLNKNNRNENNENLIYLIGPRGPRGKSPEFEIESVSSGVDAKVSIRKEGNIKYLSFVLPKGDKGEDGPNKIRCAYLVTFNETGEVSVDKNNSIPITRKEIDSTNLVSLNSEENEISFNTVGYYKISIIASAYVKKASTSFDEKTDFASVAFREKNTDNIYIGASKWIKDEIPSQIKAEGVVAVVSEDTKYELVNVGNQILYLNSPDLNYISSNSYFTNSLVTINIEYLGKMLD